MHLRLDLYVACIDLAQMLPETELSAACVYNICDPAECSYCMDGRSAIKCSPDQCLQGEHPTDGGSGWQTCSGA